jgi:hypothetical protein
MANTSYLYLLVFPQKNIIKIGKADDIHNRIQALRRWWGDVDYDASYQLEATQDTVLRLEKSLHFLLSSHAVSFEQGDGRTELFSYSALETALKHIELYVSSGALTTQVRKGVIKPVPKQKISTPRRSWRHAKLLRNTKAMVRSVSAIAEKFGRINRILHILLRKQAKVAFQYDIIEDQIYFRLRLGKNYRDDNVKIMQLFSFKLEDHNGWYGLNCCSVSGLNDVVQYEIRLLSLDQNERWHPLFSYFASQSERLLARLPTRSSAATADLPLLNGSEIMASILEGKRCADERPEDVAT